MNWLFTVFIHNENSNSFIAKIKKIKSKIFNDFIPIEFQNNLTIRNLRSIKKYLIDLKKKQFKHKTNAGLFDSVYNCIKIIIVLLTTSC